MNENSNPNAMKYLFEFAGKSKGKYLISMLLALLGVGTYLAVYFVMAEVIRQLVAGNRDMSFYAGRCLVMAGLWLVRQLLHAFSTTVSHTATFHVLADIRKALLQKLALIPLGIVQEQPSGSYKNTICERVDSIETTLAHIVPEFTANIAGAIVLFVYMIRIDWRIGLWSLITVPLALVTFVVMMAKMPKYFPQTVEKTKALNDTAVEYINGIEVIKAFGQSKTSYGKFVKAAREGADCYIDWMGSCIFEMGFGMSVMPATLVSVLPAGVLYCMNGTLDVSDFIFLIILSFGVISPLITVYGYMDDLSQIGVIMSDVANVLDKENLDRPSQAKVYPNGCGIELKDVHFSYKDKEVLHGITLDIKEGNVAALVGPSGSGKSTIAKLIASLWDADSGTIALGGIDIKMIPLDVYNSYISYVSQDNFLFDLTVMENIRLGRPGASDEEVIEAAKRCGCHDFILSLEKGYDTICGGAGGHLSGGERQRISIARAMLKDASVIILDEATSYTDPESEAVIQSALSSLIKGKTVLVIAHRLSTIKDADEIFVIKEGNLEARGTHDELLSRCELYKNMWNAHTSARGGEVCA